MDQTDTVHSQDRLVSIHLAQVIKTEATGNRVGMRLELTTQVLFKPGISDLQYCSQIIGEHSDASIPRMWWIT